MKTLEDFGFYCIDHLPPALLEQSVGMLEAAGFRSVAVALDAFATGALGDVEQSVLAARSQATAHTTLLFLDARDDVLIRRYSETRRRHPFADRFPLREAILAERAALAPLRAYADTVIDTSTDRHASLKAKVAAIIDTSAQPRRLIAAVVAFGFKFGIPLDADMLFDVRFLRNPNYEPRLRERTGEDAEVAAYIQSDPAFAPFVERLFALLDVLLPRYVAEGKSVFTLAFGCTGGRHRSVHLACQTLGYLQRRGDVEARLHLRDSTQ